MYLNQKSFGKRLMLQRKIKGYTQDSLAEAVGVQKKHISNMERGVSACSIDLLLELSETLDVSTDYLLTGKNEKNTHTKNEILSVIAQLSMIAQKM